MSNQELTNQELTNQEPVARFKVCIFGNGGVGKTTLTNRYLTGVFKDDYIITIGMNFYVKKVQVDGILVSLQIWDFAGEERFRFLLPSCVSGAHGVIFMYDITRFNTFENLNDWLTVFNNVNEKSNQSIPSILVGSKLDLKESRTVSKEDCLEFIEKNGLLDYIECSAKDGINVDETFEKIARILMLKRGILIQ